MTFSLAILGTGNMGEALISGLVRQTLKPRQIVGYDVDRNRLKALKKKYKIRIADSAEAAVSSSSVILLAVKPQQMTELLTSIQPSLTTDQLFLSIAAGLDTAFFAKHLGPKIKVIRLMPNTPALIGKGITVFFANTKCSASDKKQAHRIFSAVGEVLEIKQEKLLDAVTGLSGSGPAYVYSFLDALIRGGTTQGLSEAMAERLAIQTVLGATALFEKSSEPAATLIARVASKGGTTEAGLKVLNKRNFKSIVESCIAAATNRAAQLRKL